MLTKKRKTFITEARKMFYIDEYGNRWDVTDMVPKIGSGSRMTRLDEMRQEMKKIDRLEDDDE